MSFRAIVCGSILSGAIVSGFPADSVTGIGVVLVDRTIEGAPLRISRVLAQSGAEKAGLKEPLFLIRVDGTNVVGMTVKDAAQLLRGQKGSVVQLAVANAGRTETNEFRVVRRVIELGR
jgi:carboxyl-terminal processing protease